MTDKKKAEHTTKDKSAAKEFNCCMGNFEEMSKMMQNFYGDKNSFDCSEMMSQICGDKSKDTKE